VTDTSGTFAQGFVMLLKPFAQVSAGAEMSILVNEKGNNFVQKGDNPQEENAVVGKKHTFELKKESDELGVFYTLYFDGRALSQGGNITESRFNALFPSGEAYFQFYLQNWNSGPKASVTRRDEKLSKESIHRLFDRERRGKGTILMTSKERVRRAISHRAPDRVPVGFEATPAVVARLLREKNCRNFDGLAAYYQIDICDCHPDYIGGRTKAWKEGGYRAGAVDLRRRGAPQRQRRRNARRHAPLSVFRANDNKRRFIFRLDHARRFRLREREEKVRRA